MDWWILLTLLFIPFLGIFCLFIWTDINLQKAEDECTKGYNYSLLKIHDLVAYIAEQGEQILYLKKELEALKHKKQ
jgi:hypothetical protein